MENEPLKFARGLQHAFGQPRRVQASFRADEVLREMNSKLCEWCDKDMTTSCCNVRDPPSSKACMKSSGCRSTSAPVRGWSRQQIRIKGLVV